MPFVIPSRFCGPPQSGNGGWVSGKLALFVTPSAEQPAISVRLATPPPLDRPLTVRQRGDDTTALMDGSVLVAVGSAAPEPDAAEVPAPLDLESARAAEAAFDGSDHPFPKCYVCGTARDPGDGMRLFPGPVPGRPERDLRAAVWNPTSASTEETWAALDCPGAWSLSIDDFPMVLGTMTAVIRQPPTPGHEHVVLGWSLGGEGRKRWCGTAIYLGETLLAHAEATWVILDAKGRKSMIRSIS